MPAMFIFWYLNVLELNLRDASKTVLLYLLLKLHHYSVSDRLVTVWVSIKKPISYKMRVAFGEKMSYVIWVYLCMYASMHVCMYEYMYVCDVYVSAYLIKLAC